MLGLINLSLRDFIVDTFGADIWESIRSQTSITTTSWISSCPYSDNETFE